MAARVLSEIKVERDVEMKTRDGVILRADVYRPKAEGPFPVLVCRTPYDKAAPLNADFAKALAARGYIAVTQDIRGSHRSDGNLVWQFKAEAFPVECRDGEDCVHWAAELPGSDGRVGTFGVSYSSWLSWCMAAHRPPPLRALAMSGIPASIHDLNFGIFETGRRLQWTFSQASALRHRAGDTGWPDTLAEANEDWLQIQRGKWTWHLPLDTIPAEVFGPLDGDLKAYMREQARELWPLPEVHRGLDIPVLVQTGWWDRLSLCISHYTGMVENGAPDVAGKHRLYIGPWPHHPFGMKGRIGPVNYGPEADVYYPDMIADWYDFHYKGRATALATGAPVQLFIVNDNTWQGFETWPPPAMRETAFHLGGGGSANTPAGDGRLTREAPGADEPADHYTYDPVDPVMSLMGADSQMLPVDQRRNARRRDILVYQTEPLAEDLLLIGPVRMELWAASDRPDTDFAVKLIEVRPDGLAINLSSGILRARYREGYHREVMLTPGEPTLLTIGLLPVGVRLQTGSRLRVDIASADFPAFDRNHNTGRDDLSDATLVVAHQTIFHDAAHPSRIVLPVVAEE